MSRARSLVCSSLGRQLPPKTPNSAVKGARAGGRPRPPSRSGSLDVPLSFGRLRAVVEIKFPISYKPLPAKRVYIPKDEHSQRPLGLPALEDKIVQAGIATILGAIYEADFLECSYGFRPGRGCHQALNAVDKTIMTQPVNHLIDADIKGFFDNVSQTWLMKFLQVRIKDPSFLLLVRRFLKAGYLEAGRIVVTEQGTPQGGNLSPMLSNVFLHYVLDLWFEKRLKRQVRGACFLVRYADDFVCMVQYQDDAQNMLQALRERFTQFDLALHPEKTRVISFGRYERQNAQRQNRRANTFDFLGFTHYCVAAAGGSSSSDARPAGRSSARSAKSYARG